MLDFIEKQFPNKVSAEEATDFVISELQKYSENHLEKIVGISMPDHVAKHCPRLCPRLWAELDIVPLVLSNVTLIDRVSVEQPSENGASKITAGWDEKPIDEQAESMARKGVRLVDPFRYQEGVIVSNRIQVIWSGEHALATSGLSRACGSGHSLPCANCGPE